MNQPPDASIANTRGAAIIAVLVALGIRRELAKLAMIVILMMETAIKQGRPPNFYQPMRIGWIGLDGEVLGIQAQIENDLIGPGSALVQ